MSVVRLLLCAVVVAVVFAVLASVAPAATPGGATYDPAPAGANGGADYGVAAGRIDVRPIAAALEVAPHRLRVGHLPRISFRIRQRGVTAVDVRLRVYRAASRSRARRLTTDLHVGTVPIGHEIAVSWPRTTKLAAGRYVVSLHATDPTGRTLARTSQWPGQAVVTILPKPQPAPTPTPTPAPVTPVTVVAPSTPGVFPVQGPYTFGGDDARFGAGRKGHIHEGQDVTAATGTPVVSPTAGTVTAVDFQAGGAGYYVVVHAVDGRDFFFCHFQKGSTLVTVGQAVAAGQQLGAVGMTGDATGPHLHFEIWVGGWQAGQPIDPLPQLKVWAGVA